MYLLPQRRTIQLFAAAMATSLILTGCAASSEGPPITSNPSPHWGGFPLDQLDPSLRGTAGGDEANIEPEPEPDYVGDLIDLEIVPLIEGSTWADSYVTNEMRGEQTLIIHGKSDAPRDVRREVRALAAKEDLTVEFESSSLMTGPEFVAAVEAAYDQISPDRRKFGAIAPNAAYTSVTLAVWQAADTETTIEALERALAPLEVRAFISARPTQGPKDTKFSSRWSDSSPFKAGAAIQYSSVDGTLGCTSGFAAKRNSDGKKVIITARHCNGSKFYVPGSSALFGTTGATSSEKLDVRYLLPESGKTYGSTTYFRDWKSGEIRFRKNSGSDPTIDREVWASGAFSGHSRLKVVAVNTFDPDGWGPGFLTRSVSGEPTVGHGDSGGPVFSYHSDKEYTPRGMIDGVGFYFLGGTKKKVFWDQVPCSQGAQGGRTCSHIAFHINIDAIESALGITVYKP